jgi:hypothetical protein
MYHHTVSPAMHIKLDASMQTKSHRLSLLLPNLFTFIHCSLHLTTLFSTMFIKVDQSSNVASDIPVADTESAAEVESEAPSSTSSSTMVDQAMDQKEIPLMYEYWKVPMVTDKDITTYHGAGWLEGVLVCNPSTLDFPTIDRTNIVCFELYLMCGLGLPPSKFLVSILNYVLSELVHLHPNALQR